MAVLSRLSLRHMEAVRKLYGGVKEAVHMEREFIKDVQRIKREELIHKVMSGTQKSQVSGKAWL